MIRRASVWVIAALVVAFMVLLLTSGVSAFGSPSTSSIEWTSHEQVVDGLEGQVAMLKWVGSVICAALASAIAVLWRTNLRKERTILDEVKAGRDERLKTIAALDRTCSVLDKLEKKIGKVGDAVEHCDRRREHELAGGD